MGRNRRVEGKLRLHIRQNQASRGGLSYLRELKGSFSLETFKQKLDIQLFSDGVEDSCVGVAGTRGLVLFQD